MWARAKKLISLSLHSTVYFLWRMFTILLYVDEIETPPNMVVVDAVVVFGVGKATMLCFAEPKEYRQT